MRTWTLAVSIVFHLCVIAGVVVSPLLATGELPVPPRTTEYVLVTASLPELPAPHRSSTRTTSTTPAPIEPQDQVLPEANITPPAPGPTDFDVIGGNPTGVAFVPGTVVGGDPLPVPPTPPVVTQPIRVSGLQVPRKIRDVAPRYPTIAQASRVEGVVILEAVIAEDGSVQDVRVLRSKPLLDDAAVEAVRQWRFTPTLLNGQVVPVVMTVTVSFSLK